MRAKLYHRPNGDFTIIDVTEISNEDRHFFQRNGIEVSLEDIGMFYVLWAKYGPEDTDEVTHIVPHGQTCREAMSELRKLVEEAKKIKPMTRPGNVIHDL